MYEWPQSVGDKRKIVITSMVNRQKELCIRILHYEIFFLGFAKWGHLFSLNNLKFRLFSLARYGAFNIVTD